MTVQVTLNGVTFTLPDPSDSNWGYEVNRYLKEIPKGLFSKSGGSWPLTGSDLDFGNAFGLIALYLKSKQTSIANAGFIRMANGDDIAWRNAANDANLFLNVGVGDKLFFNGYEIADNTSVAEFENKTIDAEKNTILNIRDAEIAYDAAIDFTKIAIDNAEIPFTKVDTVGKIKDADIASDANISASKVDGQFGDTKIITAGGLALGTTYEVTLKADPTENYEFYYPDTDGSTGQVLAKSASGKLEWVSIPGLNLNQNHVLVGGASNLPVDFDSVTLGDILFDEATGATIKTGVIDNTHISPTAAIQYSQLESTPLDTAGGNMTGLLGLDAEGLLFDTASPSPATPAVGQTYWDDQDKTIATKLSADVTLQHGQEMHLYVLNNSGALIENGSIVYVNSANPARPTIRKAQADSATTADLTIGVVTADIADSGYGYVTTFGLVRGLTTNVDGDGQAVSDGTAIFLSASTAGEWVKTAPTAPNHRVRIGQVLNAGGGTSGTILVSVEHGCHLDELHDVKITSVTDRDTLEYDNALGYWKNIPSVNQYTKEETGFADPSGLTVTYNGDRTVTITHGTAIIYLYRGEVFNLGTTWTSTAHNSTVDQSYYLTLYENGAHSWATTFPGFDDGVYATYVYYGASHKFALRECHGLMNWQAWEEFHRTIGTYRVSGGLVPGASWVANTYTIAAVTPAVDSAVINDEDLPTTIPAFADGSTYTRAHVDTGVLIFTVGSTLPYPQNGTDIQYNQNPSSGTALTAITTNARFVNIYGIFVPATADTGSQNYRILWMTGQQIYTTLAAAQGEDFRTLNTGNLANLFPEFVPFIRVTYERQTGGGSGTTFNARIPTNGVSYIVGTRAGLTSVTGFTPTDHNTLTGRSDAGSHTAAAVAPDTTNFNRALSVADTTVQAALDTIDNTMVTPTSSDTLTNKTLTAAVISDFETMTEIATPTTPSAGLLKVYAKTDDKLYTLNSAGVETPVGSGSGSSSEVNYISNFNFEETANGATPAGWVTYADAAAATPVDGTGGSPTVTFTASTSSPIRGLVSAVFTKDAANRQGEGVAYAFTIPAVDKSKKVGINFDITPGGSYASSDMSVYVYDVTNSALLTPSAVSIPNLTGTFTTSFDLTAGTSYRLILHVASTNASAYTVKVDNVSVGYKPTPQGAVVEEWKSYTPDITNFPDSSVVFKYRRVGDSVHIRGKSTATGAVTGVISIPLPAGMTIDTTKIGGTAPNYNPLGDAEAVIAGVYSSGMIGYSSSNSVQILSRSAADYWNATVPGTWANTSILSVDFLIPIAEWAGSGTVNLAQNDVEYAASTNGTWDAAAAAANTVYGPAGAPISGALSATRAKVVKFQTPIQIGSDRVSLEFYHPSRGWIESQYSYQGMLIEWPNAEFGAQMSITSSTEVTVIFYRYGSPGATYNNATGTDWNTGYVQSWRVRKTSAGAAVGFGVVQPGVSAGLVSASGLPGRTDGQAVAAGYVGQVIPFTARTVTGILNNIASNTSALETLTAGVWLVYARASWTPNTSITNIKAYVATNNVADFSGGVSYFDDSHSYTASTEPMSMAIPPLQVVNVSSSTPIYAKSYSGGIARDVTVSGFAIRIA